MSISVARKKRTALFLSIAGLMLTVAALSALSARDPDGIMVRTGMILVTLGAAMWLPWQALLPATFAIWLGPNIGRDAVESYELFNTNMMLELPGLLILAAVSTVTRMSLRDLEQESILLGMTSSSVGTDPMTGVFEESQLRSSLEIELSRSRRFGRGFALVLVGIDEMRQRFDYRDEEVWQASFAATAELLRGTRANVDRVYRYGPAGFAMLLPESGPKDVNGLVRRLRRVGRKAKPPEGEPGGPLPAHYGATFFPTCATTVDDLIRRAEIALKISDNNASRVQLDGAEAPEMPPVETLRQIELESAPAEPQATPATEPVPLAAPELRIVEPEILETLEPEPIVQIEEPVMLQTVEASPAEEAPIESAKAEMPQPTLSAVEESPANQKPEPLQIPEPVAGDMAEPITASDEGAEDATAEPTSAPIYAVEAPPDYSMDPDAIEVDEEPPLEVFAYRAPEPAVDVYNRDWQTEAPLSVIRRPQAVPKLVAVGGGVSEPPPVYDVVNDALKQLDDTLELIRALKQRSA